MFSKMWMTQYGESRCSRSSTTQTGTFRLLMTSSPEKPALSPRCFHEKPAIFQHLSRTGSLQTPEFYSFNLLFQYSILSSYHSLWFSTAAVSQPSAISSLGCLLLSPESSRQNPGFSHLSPSGQCRIRPMWLLVHMWQMKKWRFMKTKSVFFITQRQIISLLLWGGIHYCGFHVIFSMYFAFLQHCIIYCVPILEIFFLTYSIYLN